MRSSDRHLATVALCRGRGGYRSCVARLTSVVVTLMLHEWMLRAAEDALSGRLDVIQRGRVTTDDGEKKNV